MRRPLAACLAAAMLWPCQAWPAADKGFKKGDYPPYLIGPGDLLSITVYGEKDLPTGFLVDSGGTITFPLIGEIKLAGLTQGQASSDLERQLAHFLKAPQVTVLIEETNSYTVSVLGEVARPGKFRIRGMPKLLSVLAEAGGPLENADLANAVLIRDNAKSVLNLEHYLRDLDNRETPPLLYPGDAILVPRSPWPTLAEWGIIVSILAGASVLAVTVDTLRSRP